MTRRIIIEGQMVRLVEEAIVGETTLNDLRPLLATRAPTIFPVQPDHTRIAAFNPEKKKGIIIIELLPARHNLRVFYDRGEIGCTPRDYGRADDQQRANFNIQLPYQYFVYTYELETRGDLNYDGQIADFTLNRGDLYWRKEPLTGITDLLIPAQIWNVRNAQICWGYQRHDTQTLAQRIDDMVKNFPFTDFTAHYGSPVPNGYDDYTAWEEASEGNPFVFRDWTDFDTAYGHGLTVKSLIDRAIENTDEVLLADTTRTFDAIPEPPPMFTIGRAIDWFENLPENLRPRFLWALNRYLTGAEPPEGLELNPIVRPEPEPTPVAEPTAVAAAAEGNEVDIPGVGRVTIRRRRTGVATLADGTTLPAGMEQTTIDPDLER